MAAAPGEEVVDLASKQDGQVVTPWEVEADGDEAIILPQHHIVALQRQTRPNDQRRSIKSQENEPSCVCCAGNRL